MNKRSFHYPRRNFIYDLGITVLSLPVLSAFTSKNTSSNKKDTSGKLGIALVGLGQYSAGQLAPALQETKDCYLAGIVTGSPDKAARWKEKYSIPAANVYDYTNFDDIRNNPDIDIIYVVLPNSMHAEYVVRAAKAGKHVICEKPMAITVEECDRMIAACKAAGKMLSIGYRLNFEPFNLEMKRMGQQKIFGAVKKVSAGFGFVSPPNVWRLNKKMAGGGPLEDVGIYCIQGVCYTSGMEPIAVKAQEGIKHDAVKFKDVEESLTWQMEMPDGTIAECKASYGENYNFLHAEADKGWFELSPAYSYDGLAGQTSKGKIDLPNGTQQARQMDDFAQAIKNKRPTPVPGEMGRRDVKIITAIYEAMHTGKRVLINS